MPIINFDSVMEHQLGSFQGQAKEDSFNIFKVSFTYSWVCIIPFKIKMYLLLIILYHRINLEKIISHN